jgi:hypothetical protein
MLNWKENTNELYNFKIPVVGEYSILEIGNPSPITLPPPKPATLNVWESERASTLILEDGELK